MDRLSTLITPWTGLLGLWLLAAPGCTEGESTPPRQRVVAVTAEQRSGPDLESFCDVHASGTAARQLDLPPLDHPERARTDRWRWINVWATWCQPCIEEMPMLLEWQRRLSERGNAVELIFLSVDETSEVVDEFRRTHPRTPPSLRLSDHEALPGWITSLGMDQGATLPLQIFADPRGGMRCARSGAVNASHFDTVRQLVTVD